MPGLGTIVNALAIVAAGLCGSLFGGRIPARYQDTLMSTNAIAVLFLGIGGAVAQMLRAQADGTLLTTGTMMMILSLAIGCVIGEWFNLEDKFESLGQWLKQRTGNSHDNSFVDAFVTASLTVCIGAMAVIGSINDGILGDHSVLFAKAVLDFVIILIMTASLGKGCLFAALPVAVLQGTITMLASFLKPFITAAAMANLSFVGSILIFCVGVNLLWGKKIRVANLLPSLVLAMVWAFLPLA